MDRTLIAAAVAVVALGTAAPAGGDTTTRIFLPGGQGYTDETRNDRGDVVRTQTYDADGRPTTDTSYDPDTHEPTGSTEQTYRGDSKQPETTTRRDGEGTPRTRDTLDGEGRVARHETYDEDAIPETRTEYHYDEDGNLTDTNIFDGDGNLATSQHYGWKDGRLTDVSSIDHTGHHPENEGQIFYNPDGSISEQRGNVDDALAVLGLPGIDPNTHTSTDAHGNRITVTHNPDGTFDVTIVHPDRRVTLEHLRHGAGCYLGDDCPFGGRPGQAPAGVGNGDAGQTADGTPDEPISMGPARTGGTRADVHVPKPNIDVGHPNVPHVPPSKGGKY